MDEVQIRYHNGKLVFFETLQEAYQHWVAHRGVTSKMSFDFESQAYRFRPRPREKVWNKHSEERLCTISESYRIAKDGWFWIDQLTLSPDASNWDFKRMEIDKDYDDKYQATLIRAVYSDEEFRRKFGISGIS